MTDQSGLEPLRAEQRKDEDRNRPDPKCHGEKFVLLHDFPPPSANTRGEQGRSQDEDRLHLHPRTTNAHTDDLPDQRRIERLSNNLEHNGLI